MVMMGGRRFGGEEWNLAACGGGCGSYDQLGDISYDTLALWPQSVPIVIVPYEGADEILTGGVGPVDQNPCYSAYVHFCHRMHGWCTGFSRASWDPVAVVVAVRGTERFYTLEPGEMMFSNPNPNPKPKPKPEPEPKPEPKPKPKPKPGPDLVQTLTMTLTKARWFSNAPGATIGSLRGSLRGTTPRNPWLL